jgi:hypothetical protein
MRVLLAALLLVVLATGCAANAPLSDAPSATSARSTRAFTVGINAGSAAAWEAGVSSELRPSVVRIDFDISTPPAKIAPTIAALAARGSRVQPVATFVGRMPGDSDAGRVAAWARAFGPGGTFWKGRSDGRLAVRYIEFGNETNQGYQYDDCGPGCSGYRQRARDYALRFKETQQAIHSGRGNRKVGLLAIADESGDSTWTDGMYEAVPDLTRRVAGWIAHPYGPDYMSKLAHLAAGVSGHGAGRVPIFVTEFGIATDDGRCLDDNYGWPKCLTYRQAADRLRRAVKDMHTAYGKRLAQLLIFAQVDQKPTGTSSDREAYFGAVQSHGQPKGPLTTVVRSLLSANRAR